MSSTSDSIPPAIRAWLRNDCRLGIQHIGVIPGTVPAEEVPAATPVETTGRVEPPSRPPAEPARRPAPERPAPRPKAATESVVSDPDGGLARPVDRALPLADVRHALAELDENFVRSCTRCDLHAARNRTVFGVGNPQAELMFVGEGPGADEDRQGEPFVGKAGQLLTRMIAAMTLPRSQVYIANVVKCRPPENRTPTPEETSCCAGYLWRQIALIRPRVIVALGRPAAHTLLATTTAISRLRGQFHDFPPEGLKDVGLPSARVMPTFHPAYLLRTPSEKAKAWSDLKQVMTFLDIPIP